MTSTTAISLPRFLPLRSFLAHAVGEERIEVKPEWAGVFTPSTATAIRKNAA